MTTQPALTATDFRDTAEEMRRAADAADSGIRCRWWPPDTARAVADWLEQTAERHQRTLTPGDCYQCIGEDWPCRDWAAAERVVRAFLEPQPVADIKSAAQAIRDNNHPYRPDEFFYHPPADHVEPVYFEMAYDEGQAPRRVHGPDRTMGTVMAEDRVPLTRPWRVGRSVGRTVYQQTGPDPSKADTLIGVMDTPELAALVVRAVNRLYEEEARP